MASKLCKEIPLSNDLTLEEYKKIFENIYDEIFVINKDGIVVYINEACERNYGMKPSELIGKSIRQLASQGCYNPFIAPIVLKEKKRVTLEQETRMGIKLVVTATPVLDDHGEIQFVVMNGRDITQIADLKFDLQETEKLVKKFKNEIEELRKKELIYDNIIARSPEMEECLELSRRVASVDSTILILGESGTGKNVMAKYIHKMSQRKDGPFIHINCAAIPEQLLESELFGYCRGAFTGADKDKMGLFELASGGTLFLDEIAEIPLKLQAKLLGAIQESKIMPVGGRKIKEVDIRIITATNRDLEKLVEAGGFREDLYYRLNVIAMELPSLRGRKEDIIPLLHHFLNNFDKKYKTSHRFSPECIEELISYSWPGNIRELEHLVERLVVTCQEGKILPQHLPKNIYQNKSNVKIPDNQDYLTLDKGVSVKEIEKELVINAFKEFGSSYKVATKLNISQSKANRLIRKYFSEIEYLNVKKKIGR